jgi:hypothetical protein
MQVCKPAPVIRLVAQIQKVEIIRIEEIPNFMKHYHFVILVKKCYNALFVFFQS